jgi:hypothetical protein
LAGVEADASMVCVRREKRMDAMAQFSSSDTERREARVDRSSRRRDSARGDCEGRRVGRDKRSWVFSGAIA